MQRRIFSSLKKSAGALGCAALLCGHARGAELGEPSVHSFIGQPLLADIELTALAPDEVTGLQVNLASPDVYRGANIGMNPALASLHLSLMRHDDQHQFLHLSSLRAVEANHLLLFLTLSAGGRNAVRSATLWLSPAPRPAAPPAAALAIDGGQAASPAAPPAAPPVAPPAINGGHAVTPGAVLAEHPPRIASLPHAALQHFRAQPAPVPARACAPQASEQAQACAELDIRNTVLSSKIVELEGKVKVLQVAFQPRLELAPGSAPTSIKPGTSAQVLHPAQTADTPSSLLAWSVGAGLIALTGGFLFLRRKNGKMPFKPSRYWVLSRWPFRPEASTLPAPK